MQRDEQGVDQLLIPEIAIEPLSPRVLQANRYRAANEVVLLELSVSDVMPVHFCLIRAVQNGVIGELEGYRHRWHRACCEAPIRKSQLYAP